MQGMSSVKLPLDMPSLENITHESTDLPQRIHTFCQEQKEKRRHEWESLKVALEKMKESKEKCHVQQAQEERDATYAQMVQSLEKTRAMVRNSVSRASTISAEECQLTLMEDDFMVIQRKMDKINQRLDELYKNWHVEYRDAVSAEDCEEIRTVLQTLPGKNMNQNIRFYNIYYKNLVLFLHENPLLKSLLV